MLNNRLSALWGMGWVVFLFIMGTTVFGEEKTSQELVSQGNALYLKGDFKEALDVYQQALLLQPEDITKSKIHYNLGNTYYRLGELKEAFREYQEALRLDPNDKEAKFNLEVVLRALEGQKGVLQGGPSEVQGGPKQDSLDEEVRLILQKIDEQESRDTKGIPTPPSDEKKPKEYKKDW